VRFMRDAMDRGRRQIASASLKEKA